MYASGIAGIAGDSPDNMTDNLEPLFDLVIKEVAPPVVEVSTGPRRRALCVPTPGVTRGTKTRLHLGASGAGAGADGLRGVQLTPMRANRALRVCAAGRAAADAGHQPGLRRAQG